MPLKIMKMSRKIARHKKSMPINTNLKTKKQRGTKCVKIIFFFTPERANRLLSDRKCRKQTDMLDTEECSTWDQKTMTEIYTRKMCSFRVQNF